MPPHKIYKYREVLRMLRKHDKRFEQHVNRGKGSHRVIFHPNINGKPAFLTIPCHSEGDDVKPVYVRQIVDRFSLPSDFF